jgi:DNA ligase-1
MTDRFPEFMRLLDYLPAGTVLDGEILGWKDAQPLPFADLQKRIGRKTTPAKLLRDTPVILYAYDLLEWEGEDIRNRPFLERRALLDTTLRDVPSDAPIKLSPQIKANTWEDFAQTRAEARAHHAEGLMLKRSDSLYLAGRKKGDWWKWKLDPLTIDAVMIYAQSGHGRRATLFTDYTFAVWQDNDLIPFTKAYSGLTDAEFRQITTWVRKNTLQRFGPVRQVPPEHVFEIAFEGIQRSTRHKSGVALRFPRMLRWRQDKAAQDANSLDDLKEILRLYG